MIINVTGYGSTGASAYVDILKEFDNIQFFPDSMEFQLLHEPDGILDLEYAFENAYRTNIQVAISRFKRNAIDRTVCLDNATNGQYRILKNNYISSLCNVEWKGKSIYDPCDLKKWYETGLLRKMNRLIDHTLTKFNKYLTWPPENQRFISNVSHNEFICLTMKYISDILSSCGFDFEKDILLEQLYNASTPLRGSNLVPDKSISIVVDRDPRDVYIITNYLFPYYNRYMPHSCNVDAFINYYKTVHRNKKQFENDENVFFVNFEDSIYNYDDTVWLMKRILNDRVHTYPKKYFIPENSVNNTKLFENKVFNCSDAIAKIEDELTEYLYPFDSVDISFIPNKISPFEKQK